MCRPQMEHHITVKRKYECRSNILMKILNMEVYFYEQQKDNLQLQH